MHLADGGMHKQGTAPNRLVAFCVQMYTAMTYIVSRLVGQPIRMHRITGQRSWRKEKTFTITYIYSASLQYSLQQGTVYVNVHQEQSFVAHLTIQNDVQHIYHNNWLSQHENCALLELYYGYRGNIYNKNQNIYNINCNK